MCGICGCGGAEATVEGEHHHHHDHGHDHTHVLADGRVIHHSHGPNHSHADAADLSAARLVQVERDLLETNNIQARRNRAHFAAHGVVALNLVSSPGAGKTTLLCETIARLKGRNVAVIEGDQQTSLDADRIRATGAKAVQINTGTGCHLDAQMVDRAFGQLHHDVERGILFIENVGNLVCPTGFDLGETHRIVIASVAEGEEKPLKYPGIFASADLMIVSKAEIAGPIGADIDLLIANARRVKPELPVIVLSAKTGEGMDKWVAWLDAALAMRAAAV